MKAVKQEESEISSSNLSLNNISVSNYDFLKNQLVKLNGNVVRRKFVILQNYSSDLNEEDLQKTANNIGMKFQEKFNECQIGYKKFEENQQFMIVIQLKSTCIGNTVISLLTQRLSSPIQIQEENIFITEGQKSSRSTFHFKNIFGKNYQPLNFKNNNITKSTVQDLDLDSEQEIMEEEAQQQHQQQLMYQQIFPQQQQQQQQQSLFNQSISNQQDPLKQQQQQNMSQSNQQYQQTKNTNINTNTNPEFSQHQQQLNQLQKFSQQQQKTFQSIPGLQSQDGKLINQVSDQFSQISLQNQLQSLETTNQNTQKMVKQILDMMNQKQAFQQKIDMLSTSTAKNAQSNWEEESSSSCENVLMGQKKQKKQRKQRSYSQNLERIDRKLDVMAENQQKIVTSNDNIFFLLNKNQTADNSKSQQSQPDLQSQQQQNKNPQKTELEQMALQLWIESELSEAVKKVVSDYLVSSTFGLQNLLQRSLTEFSDFFETAKQIIKIKYSFKGQKFTDFFDKIFKLHHQELEQFFAQQVLQLAQEQQRQYEAQNYQKQIQAQQSLQQQLQLQQFQQLQIQQNSNINLGLNQQSLNQPLVMAKESNFNHQQQILPNNNTFGFINMNMNNNSCNQQTQQQQFDKLSYTPQFSVKQQQFIDENHGQKRRVNIANEG
ncbi:hypothetical protein PPERSA_11308 [Pseudocohnilembus persalinus]|uniref:Uncharacterized protein n=1 Tax=Pseudocohnilembus persalinus TaxID=266149 RepID=A0A0V0QQ02_PSEPJ|nr:hypothetical protein PPERSA_11308 [Pseudocohnilembus persalinus]|eukprot:KRX04184.1 hypothetical protein PPERSA_11308 [Pseudocohnilembus persalinus]